MGPKQQVTDVEDFNEPAKCLMAAGGLVGRTRAIQKFTTVQPPVPCAVVVSAAEVADGIVRPVESEDVRTRKLLESRLFLGSRAAAHRPAVALIGMLSLVAWS